MNSVRLTIRRPPCLRIWSPAARLEQPITRICRSERLALFRERRSSWPSVEAALEWNKDMKDIVCFAKRKTNE
jgi:hypothetical protein